jgi:hypothetical protein
MTTGNHGSETPQIGNPVSFGFSRQNDEKKLQETSTETKLVGGCPTPLKNMYVTWDDYS